jgi:hypothetical protein
MPVYQAAALAIKTVAPLAAVGPSNMARPTDAKVAAALDKFADFIYEKNVPLDFVALSNYGKGNAKDSKLPVIAMSNFARRAKTGSQEGELTVPVEIHEFGVNLKHHFVKGAWAGAWAVASWLWQMQANASRFFHWSFLLDTTIEKLNQEATGGNPLVTGWGFALGALKVLVGDGRGIGALTVGTAQLTTAAGPNATFGGFRVAHQEAKELMYLIVIHPDETAKAGNQIDVELHVRSSDFPGKKLFWDLSSVSVKQRVLNSSTSVLDVIQSDLIQAGGYDAGLLKSPDPSVVDEVALMATKTGMTHVAKNAAQYMSISNTNLQDQPFDGSIELQNDELLLSFRAAVPSLHLLTLSGKSEQRLVV